MFPSAWELHQRVTASYAQGLEMLEIARQQQMTCVLGQRGYGHIGEAGMDALGLGLVGQLAGESGRRGVQRPCRVMIVGRPRSAAATTADRLALASRI